MDGGELLVNILGLAGVGAIALAFVGMAWRLRDGIRERRRRAARQRSRDHAPRR